MKKKKLIKTKSQKVPKYYSFDMLNQNVNKDNATFLNTWEIEILERRKDILKKYDEAKRDLERINEVVNSQSRILDVKDTPQGTQLVKMISDDKYIKFHYN